MTLVEVGDIGSSVHLNKLGVNVFHCCKNKGVILLMTSASSTEGGGDRD